MEEMPGPQTCRARGSHLDTLSASTECADKKKDPADHGPTAWQPVVQGSFLFGTGTGTGYHFRAKELMAMLEIPSTKFTN